MSKKNIVLSIILGLFFIVSSYLGLHRLGGFWLPSIIAITGVILICILVALNVKKENGGYASFGNLIKHFVITISIATIIGSIFGIIQLSIMDESQKEAIVERTIDTMIDMYSNLGLNEKQLSDMEDALEKKMSDIFSPSTLFLDAITQFFLYILISLIPAAIMKKNPSVT